MANPKTIHISRFLSNVSSISFISNTAYYTIPYFQVCRRNLSVWPFKWRLLRNTFKLMLVVFQYFWNSRFWKRDVSQVKNSLKALLYEPFSTASLGNLSPKVWVWKSTGTKEFIYNQRQKFLSFPPLFSVDLLATLKWGSITFEQFPHPSYLSVAVTTTTTTT